MQHRSRFFDLLAMLCTTSAISALAADIGGQSELTNTSWATAGLDPWAMATHNGKLYSLAMNESTCGTALSCPASIYVWDGASGQRLKTVALPQWTGADAIQYAQALMITPDGDALVRGTVQTVHHSGSETWGTVVGSLLYKFNLSTGSPSWVLNSSGWQNHLGAVSASDGLLYSSGGGRTIDVIDLGNGTVVWSGAMGSGTVYSAQELVVVTPPGGPEYLVGDWNGYLAGYTLENPYMPVLGWSVATSMSALYVNGRTLSTPDGRHLVAGMSEFSDTGSSVVVFDARNGTARSFVDYTWQSPTIVGATNTLVFLSPQSGSAFTPGYAVLNLSTMTLVEKVVRPDVQAMSCGLVPDGSAVVCLSGNCSESSSNGGGSGIGVTVLDGVSGAVVAEHAPGTFGLEVPVAACSNLAPIVELSADGAGFAVYSAGWNYMAKLYVPR